MPTILLMFGKGGRREDVAHEESSSENHLAASNCRFTPCSAKEILLKYEPSSSSPTTVHVARSVNFFTLPLALVRLVPRGMAVLPLTLLMLLPHANEAIGAPTFTDANWTSVGSLPSANGPVYAAAVDGSGNLYIGGQFTSVGGAFATNIAKWNGSSWSALGSGVDNLVYALAISGNDVYVGGRFTMVGGSAASAIARWNGSSWSPLGAGVNGQVSALAVSGNDLYVGGIFTMAGGSAANHIAKWNGNSWSTLGAGMGGGRPLPVVGALAVSGTNLFAGGIFTMAGGITANHIAKWDGSRWSALGSGIGGFEPFVSALAVSGSNVYAGGEFTLAGGGPANHVAKWNGNSWSALGSGIGGDPLRRKYASVLTIAGSNLYVGGFFTNAGGGRANWIAKWNGSSWSALASGMNSNVTALAVSGSHLYVGGRFTTAGGKASSHLARAYLPALPTLSVLPAGADVRVSWPSVDTSGFALENAGAVATPANWVTSNAPITDDGTNKSVILVATNSLQFFRLRLP
jgi:hypothetical protein